MAGHRQTPPAWRFSRASCATTRSTDPVRSGMPSGSPAVRRTGTSGRHHTWQAVPAGAPPLGTRLRLKVSVDLSGFSPPLRKIFQAMKTYGLILADNGSDLFISGTMDARWNNDELNPAFRKLRGDDFEVIQLGWR